MAKYDEAVKRLPNGAKLYLTRAACHIQLGQYQSAVSDCDSSLHYEPTMGKWSKSNVIIPMHLSEES